MAIRTGLVGLVAALSLTLPSAKQIESWKQQAQSWMNARLAEWDARMPAGENAFVYVAEPPSTPVARTQPAPEITKASPESRPSDVASTAPAPQEESAILAFAENELALAIPTEPMPLEEQEIQVANDAIPAPTPIPVNLDDAFHVALTETLATFAAETASTTEMVAAVEDEPVEVIEELDVNLAFEYSRSTEGLCVLNDLSVRPAPTAPAEVVAEDPVMDDQSGDEFDPSVVFAPEPEPDTVVSRSVSVSAVTETVSTSPASASVPDRDPLARAVRLTREAAYAWASLLTGPAVVTPTH
jgi:hypothetical protein